MSDTNNTNTGIIHGIILILFFCNTEILISQNTLNLVHPTFESLRQMTLELFIIYQGEPSRIFQAMVAWTMGTGPPI